MTDNCQITWQPTQEQVDKIILPGMQDIAQQCSGYINVDCVGHPMLEAKV